MEVIESIHLLLILNVRFGWYLRKIGQWVQPQLAATRMFPPEKQRLIVNEQLWLEFPFLPCPAQIGLLAGTSSPAAADQSQVSKAELLNKWQ